MNSVYCAYKTVDGYYCYKGSDGMWYSGLWNAKEWHSFAGRYAKKIAQILDKLDEENTNDSLDCAST